MRPRRRHDLHTDLRPEAVRVPSLDGEASFDVGDAADSCMTGVNLVDFDSWTVTRSPSFRISLLVLFALFSCIGFINPAPVSAQQAGAQTSVAEGYALHRPTKSFYFYRISPDSMVYLRKGRSASSDSAITVPAQTLASIYQRTEEKLMTKRFSKEYVVFGYEDQNLVLRFSQQFNLYVLGTLIAVVLVGGILLAWLWWRLSKEQRRREALAQSRRYLTEGREKERERLAQEIHDGPVQDLHGLHMQLKAFSHSDEGPQIDKVGDELMRVTGELRAMSADLHPPALQRFGLGAALRSHADRIRNRHPDVEIEMDLPAKEDRLPDEYALSVFRIAQEALNNAAQHGNATHVEVSLQVSNDTVTLDIRDDGTGFSPPNDWHDLPEEDHYGLLGMRERAEAIGAELDIESAPGNGTRVQLRSRLDHLPVETHSNESAPIPA